MFILNVVRIAVQMDKFVMRKFDRNYFPLQKGMLTIRR